MMIRASAAAVTGARHLRCARNGQDAAVVWIGHDAAGSSRDARHRDAPLDGTRPAAGELAVVVVCDGCSSGASSEVGARLGAALFARSLAARLQAGAAVTSEPTWSAVRDDVVRVLAELLERMP